MQDISIERNSYNGNQKERRSGLDRWDLHASSCSIINIIDWIWYDIWCDVTTFRHLLLSMSRSNSLRNSSHYINKKVQNLKNSNAPKIQTLFSILRWKNIFLRSSQICFLKIWVFRKNIAKYSTSKAYYWQAEKMMKLCCENEKLTAILPI